MSMKKTDLEKRLAKKLDGKLKSGATPPRFAQGAKAVAAKAEAKPKASVPKLVPVSCKLPADLAQQLRAKAVTVDGGVNAILAQALGDWLARS